MKRRVALVSWLCALIIGLAPGPVRAEGQASADTGVDAQADAQAEACNAEVPLEDKKQAARLVAEAYELHTEMRFVETGEKYREALGYWDRADIHLQAGVAFLSALRLIDAHEHISTAIRCGQGLLSAADLEEAKKRMERLRARLTQLEVRVDEPGARVLINKQEWFTGAGTRQKTLLAGQYVVTVEKPGHIPVLEPVLLEKGERTVLVPTVMSERDGFIEQQRFRPWLPWTVAGVGATLAVTGVALRLHATGRINDYENELQRRCPMEEGCLVSELRDLESKRSSASRENVIGLSVLAVGSAAAATGLFMAFVNRPFTRRHPEAGKARLEVIPLISPQGAGVTASGRF